MSTRQPQYLDLRQCYMMLLQINQINFVISDDSLRVSIKKGNIHILERRQLLLFIDVLLPDTGSRQTVKPQLSSQHFCTPGHSMSAKQRSLLCLGQKVRVGVGHFPGRGNIPANEC